MCHNFSPQISYMRSNLQYCKLSKTIFTDPTAPLNLFSLQTPYSSFFWDSDIFHSFPVYLWIKFFFLTARSSSFWPWSSNFLFNFSSNFPYWKILWINWAPKTLSPSNLPITQFSLQNFIFRFCSLRQTENFPTNTTISTRR